MLMLPVAVLLPMCIAQSERRGRSDGRRKQRQIEALQRRGRVLYALDVFAHAEGERREGRERRETRGGFPQRK